MECSSSIAPQLLKPYRRDFEAALQRRDWVISIIGWDNLLRFETWAFGNCSLIYDNDFPLVWNHKHPKNLVSSDPTRAIQSIVNIWIVRFSAEAKDSRGIITVLPPQTDSDIESPRIGVPSWSSGDDAIPGPGIDEQD